MSKGQIGRKSEIKKDVSKKDQIKGNSSDYLYSMSHAPRINTDANWFQMLPVIFFTAITIIITRMASYERPMSQFLWSGDSNQLTDFFSYYKMLLIIFCAGLSIVILFYRIFTQSFYIKKTLLYIPMAIYIFFVLLSYLFSEYKLFALWGWNDRFEGTITIISYMVMLFYIINIVNTEKNIRWIIYLLAITSSILGILGITQALDHDFFRTTIGKKLITPSWFWDQLDSLNFTFQNKEIYQTVYNINYVSFYLTLLIPLFGLLFIKISQDKGESIFKKLILGALFALLIFNLIGSASSGGLMGMAFVVLVAIVILNKRVLNWWKPVLLLLIITIAIAGVSYQRWLPELSSAIEGVVGTSNSNKVAANEAIPDLEALPDIEVRHTVDYIVTSGPSVIISFAGNEINFKTFPEDPLALTVTDSDGKSLELIPTNVSPIYKVNDDRFKTITVRSAQDDSGTYYIIIGTDGNEWPFALTENGAKYLNGLGKFTDLQKVPSIGWEKNQAFGSGRGYIWSRSIPMMKDTLLLGHGADTYCIYFPQQDYVGKYNSGTFTGAKDIVVDKPHNMYIGIILGTGGISMLALFLLWAGYIIQSFLLYRKANYIGYLEYVGAGIFLGICGFLVSALVNDSNVSVMPMFYGLLGTGISINAILKRQTNANKVIDIKEL